MPHLRYDEHKGTFPPKIIARFGNRERIQNLIWAENHRASIFRVVIAKTPYPDPDPNVPRSQNNKYCPRPDLFMKITYFDKTTGEFGAEQIP
jgi:hypothetical protein